MKLTANKRTDMKKGAIKQTRREGNIPAIVYAPDRAGEPIIINVEEFRAALRSMKQGHLPTTIFTLHLGNKERKAIVKDIQYDLTTYQVIHLDFEELSDKVLVSVKVPISCTGAAECVGIKLGGFLRQVIPAVKVECLPKDIPAMFEVDVRELGIRQTKRLSDIAMPKGVKPLVDVKEVVVVIAKR
jgi:large subunit ribosomal protein L25